MTKWEEAVIAENGEEAFKRFLTENEGDAAENQDKAFLASQIAERTLRPFGTSALAGLRAGGSFVSALKGADEKAKAKAAARLNLNREKAIARKGALLRADVPESALSAAKAAEAFLYDLGVEVAKRSDLF